MMDDDYEISLSRHTKGKAPLHESLAADAEITDASSVIGPARWL